MNSTFQFLRKNNGNQRMSTPQKKSVPFEYVTPDDARVDASEPTDVASILSTFEGGAYYESWYEVYTIPMYKELWKSYEVYILDIKEYFQRKDPNEENHNEKPPYVFSYLIDNVVQCIFFGCFYCIIEYFWPG